MRNACLIALLLTIATVGSAAAQQPQRRAKLPANFDNTGASFIFSRDVFGELLTGQRPAALSQKATPAMVASSGGMSGGPGGGMSPGPGGAAPAGSGKDWSFITPEVIQDEVKQLNLELAPIAMNIREFKGGGYAVCRRNFTELAMLFEIINETSQDVRWKESSLGARDAFWKTADVCKVGTDQSFAAVKQRSTDLDDLVRGSSPAFSEGDPDATWESIADRPPLMQRLDMGFEKKLKKWVASEAEFRSNKSEILHEAQIIAAIAQAMKQEGFDYYDDDDYVGFCDKMHNAALDMVKAVTNDDPALAREAGGAIAGACSDCHGSYR
ncbi:cytochrome c [Blastopirellula sp. J2-11]|uniref:cytochrome c n=1 Tax=Blastopirellula sp. J2-11 TaxID=2943192 RepID=UPI0021C8565F|nr:cytochrome c [Blastopirellula sp. J2-11]UUO05390.1 cytochrome c [Blastopirellula sp. J2-11]